MNDKSPSVKLSQRRLETRVVLLPSFEGYFRMASHPLAIAGDDLCGSTANPRTIFKSGQSTLL